MEQLRSAGPGGFRPNWNGPLAVPPSPRHDGSGGRRGIGPGLASRRLALDVLWAVLRRRQPLDEVLAGHCALAELATRDRAFVRLLVATVLRRLGQIDRAVVAQLTRRQSALDPVVMDVLRLGAVQLLFLGTPAHAAVKTSVALIDERHRGQARGFVNAVLRALAAGPVECWTTGPVGPTLLPDWIWQAWSAAYGPSTAERMAEAHLQEPPLDLTVAGEPTAWVDRLGGRLLPTGTVRLSASGVITALDGYGDGAWWVQDAAASLAVPLLDPAPGRMVIDACAAPGGKTAQLALAGARVVAVDRSQARLERLKETLRRLGLVRHVETVRADATVWRPDTPADAVLLDAPCTATGTIRRHPDIAHLKTPADLHALSAVQARLLDNAIAMVRPGGLLLYVTCSLQPEEGERQIARWLAAGAPAEPLPIRPDEVGGLVDIVTPAGTVRTLPGVHLTAVGGLDGFFMARLRRTV